MSLVVNICIFNGDKSYVLGTFRRIFFSYRQPNYRHHMFKEIQILKPTRQSNINLKTLIPLDENLLVKRYILFTI